MILFSFECSEQPHAPPHGVGQHLCCHFSFATTNTHIIPSSHSIPIIPHHSRSSISHPSCLFFEASRPIPKWYWRVGWIKMIHFVFAVDSFLFVFCCNNTPLRDSMDTLASNQAIVEHPFASFDPIQPLL